MPVEEASLEKVYAAEKGIAGIRVAVIALNSVVYHFMMDKAATIEWLAYSIIIGANTYGLFVYLGKPYKRYPVLMSSVFTSVLDAAFISIWLLATGGIDSPFYLLWLVSVTAIAFRYGFRETLLAAGLYAASYLTLVIALGQVQGNERDLVLRLGYLFFIAAVGALFARETAEQTRAKVELRDLARLLRESEDRFRRLSDAAFEGIAIHEHGRILECNRAFAGLFGLSAAEVVGRTAFDLVAPDSQATIAERLRRASDQPYEVVGVKKDGTRFDVEMVGRDLPYQGRTVRVVAVRDVTERNVAEREARERAALQVTNERLKEMDRMKTQFINNAAHELGTPLTPIKIQAHILRSGNIGAINEKQARSLEILQRNVDQLSLLVRDVLDASRLQAGRLAVTPTKVPLARLLADAAESFRDAADAEGVNLHLESVPDVNVDADPARVTQVLFNLIHNALKFTPAGGAITVRARATGGVATISVTDTGAGIAAEDMPRLFHPFSQIHNHALTSRSGTGLGLYVSKGIVEEHGGVIDCESEGRGRGATFRFTLPLSSAAGSSALGVELAAEHVE